MDLTTCSDFTLGMLKASLPGFEKVVQAFPHSDESVQEDIAASSDELRKNFPHLDDLTLAAFAAYIASFSGQLAKITGDPVQYSTCAAYAGIALNLAWSLKGQA